ncbi:MAG: ATP-dependent Clp protease adapter ClpS [Ghiorsea sp.]
MPTIHTHEQEQVIPKLDLQTDIKPPAMYEVFILNDDYTPMEFVEDILQRFFAKNSEEAEKITMQVHLQGRGVCALYPKDLAESKALQVESFSRQHNHPLQCLAERSGI